MFAHEPPPDFDVPGRREPGEGPELVAEVGLVDEVRMDVVPVVFGSGKRYFGSVHAQHLLEDPDAVIQRDRVLHLRYRVRR
jgi:dihydrofolate reductase